MHDSRREQGCAAAVKPRPSQFEPHAITSSLSVASLLPHAHLLLNVAQPPSRAMVLRIPARCIWRRHRGGQPRRSSSRPSAAVRARYAALYQIYLSMYFLISSSSSSFDFISFKNQKNAILYTSMSFSFLIYIYKR
jgi:hypothetical protein